MFAQINTNSSPFAIPVLFKREQMIVVPVAEEPIPFCEDLYMDELGEIIERDERVFNVFSTIVEHTSAWKQ